MILGYNYIAYAGTKVDTKTMRIAMLCITNLQGEAISQPLHMMLDWSSVTLSFDK